MRLPVHQPVAPEAYLAVCAGEDNALIFVRKGTASPNGGFVLLGRVSPVSSCTLGHNSCPDGYYT